MTDEEFSDRQGVDFLAFYGWELRPKRWCHPCKQKHDGGWFKIGSDQHEPLAKLAAVKDELRSMAVAELLRRQAS